MRTVLPAALVALLVLAPLVLAADPEPVSWGPYNAVANVNAVALAAEGTTLAAALASSSPQAPSGPTLPGAPRLASSDLAILDLGVGWAQNGTGVAQPPLGRTHVAVSRDGRAVASLGFDASPTAEPGSPPGLDDPTNPVLPGTPNANDRRLRLAYDHAPASGNFSSGPSVNASVFLDGNPVALVLSDNGERIGVATQETGFLSLWTFHRSGATLLQDARYRAPGNVTGLAADGALARLYASAQVPDGNTTRGALLVLPLGQSSPSATWLDLSAENSSARGVAASRDGSVVALGTASGRLLVFDATGGVLGEPRALALGADPVAVLDVSEDGQRVAAVSGKNLTHADPTGGGLRAVWTAGASGAVTSLAYNRTGGLLVASVTGEGVLAFGDAASDVLWKSAGGAVSVSVNGAGDTVAFGRGALVVVLRLPRGVALEHAAGADAGPLKLVKPGGSVTYDLQVRNTGAAPETVVVTGPEDPALRLFVEPASAYLKPGETKRVTLTAQAEPTFAGGRTFNLTALSLASSARDETTVRLGIQTEANVSMLLNQTELTVTPGEPATLLVGIQNKGNRDAAVGIRAGQAVTAGAPWDVVVDPSSLTLAPDSLTTVRVVVTPPAGAANGTANALTLTLEGPDVSDSATVTLRINPSVGLEVNAVGRVRFIQPGRAGEYNVTVKNTGSLARSFEAYYDVLPVEGATPRAWTVDMPPGEFRLEPGATKSIKVRILAPMDVTPADRVSVRVTARILPLNDTEPALLGNVTLFANGEEPVPTPSDDGGGSTIPGPAPLVLAAALALVALLRRRRA